MRRSHLIVVICIAVGAIIIVWWIRRDTVIGGVVLREERRRMWGYLGKPGNPVSAWCAEKLRAYDRKRRILGENSLVFDGASMCWGYSNPTSAWFAFGNNTMGSNAAYFEFALPASNGMVAAIAELPALKFRGADSNYWASRLGTNDIGFKSNTVGHGAIRLKTGTVLFVRHIDHPETVHLLSLESMDEGLWHDVNVRFQRGVVPQR